MRIMLLLTTLLVLTLMPAAAQTGGACPRKVETPPPNPEVVLENALTTKSVPEGCRTPDPVFSFFTTDPQVQAWFSVSNAKAGDRAQVDWYSPSGSLYTRTVWEPRANDGAGCYWATLRIAGTPVAQLTGLWTARILWNGVPLQSLPFTIGPIQIESVMTTASVPERCQSPEAKSQFLIDDASVHAWILFRSPAAGRMTIEFTPNGGSVYQRSSGNINGSPGLQCLYVSMDIAGNRAARLPGQWNARFLFNDQEAAAAPFSILPILLENLTSTADVPEGCAAPESKYSFLSADPHQKTWILFKGPAGAGQLRFEYYAPDGKLHKVFAGPIASGGGSQCMWTTLAIAGEPAAGLTGLWNVKISFEGLAVSALSFTIAPVYLDSALTSASGGGERCQAPAGKAAFLTTDPSVYAWFLVRGAQAGAVAQLEWIKPDGSVYRRGRWSPLEQGGSYCFAAPMAIAGEPASESTGRWSVKILWDGQAMAELPFTIGPVAVQQPTLSTSGVGCEAPSPTDRFSTTDVQAVVWYKVEGANPGDQSRIRWISPDGRIFKQRSWAISNAADYYLTDALPIAGTPAAALRGPWKVEVTWNDQPLFTLPFTIADPVIGANVVARPSSHQLTR